MNTKFKNDQAYLFFIPPSWLLAGTVVDQNEKELILSDAVYLESAGSEHSPFAEIPRCEEKDLTKISSKSWPLQEGTILHRDGILIATPCKPDLSVLTRAHTAKTIRGAK